MQEVYIRKLDQYNFVLATKLKEPKIGNCKGVKLVQVYTNMKYYYGTMYEAVKGLSKVTGKPIKLDNSLKLIKPKHDSDSYEPFIEKSFDELTKHMESLNV